MSRGANRSVVAGCRHGVACRTRREALSRRRVFHSGVGALAGAALAACALPGQGRSETGGAPRPGGPREVSFSIYGDQVTRPSFEAIQNRFNEQKAGRYTAVLHLIPGSEYIDKTLASLAADSPADVFLTYAQYKPAWVSKQLLLDLSDRWKTSRTISTRMYYPPVVEAVTYKGKQWGTPWGYNATVMFIVVDRFKERNIPLPRPDWTMQEYAELARRLTDLDRGIFGTTNAANVDGQSMFSLMWNYGKHYWVNAEETKALVNSEAAVQMFKDFQDMQFKDRSVPWSGNPYRPGFGFQQGAVAMSIQYTSVASFTLVDALEKQGISYEWRLHTFPRGPRDQQHFSQGHLWSIARNHRDVDRAWALAEWLGSLEAEKVWAETGRTPPQVPNQDLWETYYGRWPADTRKAAIDVILNTVYKGRAANFQYWATYAECQPIMRAALSEVYGEKQVPPKVAMDDAARKMDEVLRSAGR
jgi:multiple sugar transport system substrate-binding protein